MSQKISVGVTMQWLPPIHTRTCVPSGRVTCFGDSIRMKWRYRLIPERCRKLIRFPSLDHPSKVRRNSTIRNAEEKMAEVGLLGAGRKVWCKNRSEMSWFRRSAAAVTCQVNRKCSFSNLRSSSEVLPLVPSVAPCREFGEVDFCNFSRSVRQIAQWKRQVFF